MKQKRNNIVYFRINDEIKDRLYKLALTSTLTVSSLTAYIVEKYLNPESGINWDSEVYSLADKIRYDNKKTKCV